MGTVDHLGVVRLCGLRCSSRVLMRYGMACAKPTGLHPGINLAVQYKYPRKQIMSTFFLNH